MSHRWSRSLVLLLGLVLILVFAIILFYPRKQHLDARFYLPCVASPSADTYICDTETPIERRVIGALYRFKVPSDNAGQVLITLAGYAPIPLLKVVNGEFVELASHDLRAGQIVDVIDDGTHMQVLHYARVSLWHRFFTWVASLA